MPAADCGSFSVFSGLRPLPEVTPQARLEVRGLLGIQGGAERNGLLAQPAPPFSDEAVERTLCLSVDTTLM